MIRFYHVAKRYPTGQVGLDDVTFAIEKGELCFLTGASGAGKTTLLRLIFREETPSEGQILVNGRNVAAIPRGKIPYLRRSIGIVFQDFRLIDRKTVYENVTFLPRILGADASRQRRLAYEALRRVGLAHRMSAFPHQLSGGEQQRVAIARAIVNEPEILIADEPTGNLDDDLARDVVRIFLDIHRRGTTVLFATHDRELIGRVGHRALTLSHGRLIDDRRLPPGDLDTRPPAAGPDAGPSGSESPLELD